MEPDVRSKSDFQEQEVKFVKIHGGRNLEASARLEMRICFWEGKNKKKKHESIENSFCSTCTFVKGLA